MTTPPELSRREFLIASAAGLVALEGNSASDDQLLYVGTYTVPGRPKGIYLVRMNPQSGKLRQVGAVDAGAKPSFLAIHPNGRVLYAVNEVEKYNGKASGAVSAFAIVHDTGALTRRNEQPSEGAAPCFVSVDRIGRVALVANYTGGRVALLPIKADVSLAPPASVRPHPRT